MLTSHPNVNVTQGFTVRAAVLQEADNNGYIFAKTDVNGLQRYYALYASSVSSSLVFYFTPGSGSESISVSWPVALADGRPHLVELEVSRGGQTARLVVDGQMQGERSLGSSGLADCGPASPSCLFLLGGRAAGSAALQEDIWRTGFFQQVRAVTAPRSGPGSAR